MTPLSPLRTELASEASELAAADTDEARVEWFPAVTDGPISAPWQQYVLNGSHGDLHIASLASCPASASGRSERKRAERILAARE